MRSIQSSVQLLSTRHLKVVVYFGENRLIVPLCTIYSVMKVSNYKYFDSVILFLIILLKTIMENMCCNAISVFVGYQ